MTRPDGIFSIWAAKSALVLDKIPATIASLCRGTAGLKIGLCFVLDGKTIRTFLWNKESATGKLQEGTVGK